MWTWPISAHLSTRLPHDPGDPVLNTWILWWNTQAMPYTERWWNAPFLVPLPGALALSEHLLGLSVLATPLQLAGASPIAAYNVSMLLSYALSGFFAYLLAWRLTGSVLASACAGAAFACAPYRAGQLAHVQVLTSQWMPAMLLGLHAYMDTGRRRWLALFGAAWLLQALANGYYMLFLPTLILPWIAWFTPWKTSHRRAVTVLAVWIACSLPLLPALMKYREVHASLGLSRSLGDIRQFSATPGSFVQAPPLLAIWPDARASSQEHFLFPGITVVILGLGGLTALGLAGVRRAIAERSALLFYAGATLLMWALALGPGGEAGGPPSLFRPYAWLLWLPGYDGLRVPARFAMPAALCLSAAAACSVSWFLRRPGGWRRAAAAAALVGIGLDGLTTAVPMVPPPPRLAPDSAEEAAVIEIPTDNTEVSAASMYRAIFHRRPLVNGYTGHTPYHYAVLSLALRRDDTSVLRYLAREKPLAIVVNESADPGGGFRRAIDAVPGVTRLGVSRAGPMFLLPLQPAPAPIESTPVPFTARPVGSNRLLIDCGEPRTVAGVEFAMRARFRDLAERVLVEASDDGEEWREVWLGWTGEFALEGVLRDPIAAPVRIPIPSTRARHFRIYPAPEWLSAELRLLGNP